MAKQKLHAAFGHVLMCNTYEDGETFRADIKNDAPWTMYWAKGLFKNKNITTNSTWIDFPAGFIARPGDYTSGVFEHTSMGESIVFCFDPMLNHRYTPGIETWEIDADQQITMPVGTKLFLCEGEILVDDKRIQGPMQVSIKTTDKVITGGTKCYGLIFK